MNYYLVDVLIDTGRCSPYGKPVRLGLGGSELKPIGEKIVVDEGAYTQVEPDSDTSIGRRSVVVVMVGPF